MPSCYRPSKDQPRLIRGRHSETCPMVDWHPPLTWDCAGCQPCTQPHCGTCNREHVTETTCPNCVGEVRTAINTIVQLSGLPMVDELLARGTQSEAAHLLGPTANPKAWRQRRQYGYRNHPDDMVGMNHPLWVLGTWDLLVTEHFGHTRTTTVTISSAADYLLRNLTDLAQDDAIDFPGLSAEVQACVSHLENVVHTSEQVERAAPCVKCANPLIKTDNGYRCNRCRDDLSENQYRLAVKAAHVAHADRLNVDDLAARISVPASTIRSWASTLRVQRKGEDPVEFAPLIRSCGRDGGNRKVYRVADVVAVRDTGGDRRRASSDSRLKGSRSNTSAGSVSNHKAPVCPEAAESPQAQRLHASQGRAS